MSAKTLAALPLVVLALAGCTQGSPYGAQVGDQAPPFTLTDIDDETFALEDQQGKVVMIDLMGSNCSTCRAGMHELVKVRDRFDRSEVVFVSVDLGSRAPGNLGGEDEEEVRDFKNDFDANWSFAMDTDDVGKKYQTIQIPTTFLVGPEGVIHFKHTGVLSADDLEQEIRDAGA